MVRRPAEGTIIGSVIPSLVRWGLTADADLVFRSLSTFGPQPLRRLANELGMETRRVQSALDELEAAGIAHVRAKHWYAMPVDLAVATVRNRRLRPADAAPAPLRALGFDGANAGGGYPARHLPDRTSTRGRIAELLAMERVEHLAMNPERAFSVATLAVATPLDVALLRRGVRLRALGCPPIDGDASASHAEQVGRFGAEYRESMRLAHKLMIFDRRIALVAIDPLDLDRGALEVAEPAVVESFVALFNRYWDASTDPRRNGVSEVVLTPREKAIVALLAAGHTDSTAARQLGLSTRSLTYTLRGLMDRLGVENRFQLGLALGAIGAAIPPGTAQPDPIDDPDTERSTS